MKPHPTTASLTNCHDQPLRLPDLGRRQVVADFSGGTLSTDGGALLLRQADQRLGLSRALADGFTNQRDPRFGVANLPARGFKGDPDRTRCTPPRLYEELYCGRGEMETVVRATERGQDAADRLSTHYLASNPLRLGLATFASLLRERVRARGRAGTELAAATVGRVRWKLLNVAAQATLSVRRV